MKRKILIAILAVLSCLTCAFAFVACGGEKTKKPDDTEKPSIVEVTSVTLNKTTLLLEKGGSDTLYATVSPGNATNKTVVWKSSDSSVATVSNGKVTTKKAGTTTITATVGSKSATCNITVAEKIVLHTHKLEYCPKTNSTCVKEGILEHYYCAGCGKYFADANATTEVVSVNLPLSGHRLVVSFGYEPTCTEDGKVACYICLDCGNYFSDYAGNNELISVSRPATGHSFNIEKWLNDETYHWHPASCEHTNEISKKVKHNFEDGICTDCKYSINKYVTVWGKGQNPVAQLKIDSDNKVQLPEDISTNPNSNTYFDGWFYDKELTVPITDFTFTKNTDIYTTVYSVTSTNFNYLKFTLSNGEAKVSSLGTLGKELEVLIVPRRYNGLPITCIGNKAFDSAHFRKVVMFDDIKTIEERAFYSCGGLTEVTIPKSVTSIGQYAFAYCSGLTSITFPNDVTTINEGALYYCSSLLNVVLGNRVTSIGQYAFIKCCSLTSITIPDSVTMIGSESFSGCSSLISLTIPDGVTFIRYSTFYDCSSLESVTIGSGVKSIGISAFHGCSGIKSLKIPDSVTSIDDYGFFGCSSLANVTIGSGVISIEKYAFYGCSGIKSLKIPDSVTSIGDCGFYGCSSLESVTIGSGVKSIGKYAFKESGLKSATFKVTNGWKACNADGRVVFDFLSSDLANASLAAGELNRLAYYWRRS